MIDHISEILALLNGESGFITVPFFTGALLNYSDEKANRAVLIRLKRAVDNNSPPLLESDVFGDLVGASDETRAKVKRYLAKCVAKPRLRNAVGRIHCEAGWMADALLKPDFAVELSSFSTELFIELGTSATVSSTLPENRATASKASRQNNLKSRKNVLDPALAAAQASAPDPESEESVWFSLVRMAEQGIGPDPVVGYAPGEGIQYRGKRYFDDGVELDILTRKAHRDRWYRSHKNKK